MIKYTSIYFKLHFAMWNLVSRFYFLKENKIVGECSRCGKCCLISGCPHLNIIEDKYSCNIYSHPLRKLLNCSSYPANKKAIELAKCPSYTVTEIPIRKIGNSKWVNTPSNKQPIGLVEQRVNHQIND